MPGGASAQEKLRLGVNVGDEINEGSTMARLITCCLNLAIAGDWPRQRSKKKNEEECVEKLEAPELAQANGSEKAKNCSTQSVRGPEPSSEEGGWLEQPVEDPVLFLCGRFKRILVRGRSKAIIPDAFSGASKK
ncbi:coiled-coil domain-containing protein 42A [Platysternon megacephalum]|uniref:Coiled-coil domain-containing protein 42A n=1 Tax=Platysternon megacephalum TaxID=55544 RepID=A0A4D9EDE5_9SAUR|nr:coiled-coil domain-containing protein 42A [Platysternon megacephalum]